MGHIINFIDYPKGYDKNEIYADICEEVMHEDWQEGGHYHGNLKWHGDIVYDSYEEAREAIRKMDNGHYDDHAVLYNSYPLVQESEKIKRLEMRIDNVNGRREAYICLHSPMYRKAEFIGCKHCGSRIARQYMTVGDRCPVCRTSLRSDVVQEQIEKFDAQISKLRDAIAEERKRLERKYKPQVRWLIKYEYHV